MPPLVQADLPALVSEQHKEQSHRPELVALFLADLPAPTRGLPVQEPPNKARHHAGAIASPGTAASRPRCECFS